MDSAERSPGVDGRLFTLDGLEKQTAGHRMHAAGLAGGAAIAAEFSVAAAAVTPREPKYFDSYI